MSRASSIRRAGRSGVGSECAVRIVARCCARAIRSLSVQIRPSSGESFEKKVGRAMGGVASLRDGGGELVLGNAGSDWQGGSKFDIGGKAVVGGDCRGGVVVFGVPP